MSENCSHNCSECSSECSERTEAFLEKEKLNDKAKVRRVIGVISGKGGVGKSLVTSLLAARMQKEGYRAAVLDADITGPSIPKMFGVSEHAYATQEAILPAVAKTGVQIMSVNMMLDCDTDPVIWRGPVIAGVVKQFWTDVLWDNVDYMFVDMPPGTGDVPLTVFQSLPVDGIIVVTSPQELVEMIVEKAVKMAEMMNVPVLGIVENMSWYECPSCHERHEIFGKSRAKELAARYGIPSMGQIPMDPEVARLCDCGQVEEVKEKWLYEVAASLPALL